MIYIKKSKDKQFFVDTTGNNGEILSHSETLKSRQSVWKNIAAEAKNFSSDVDTFFTVIDVTGKVERVYRFWPFLNRKELVYKNKITKS